MQTFHQLKAVFHKDPPPPLPLSDWMQPCDQCEHHTPSAIKFMKAGLGNACGTCGRLRRGKPYLSQKEFNALKPSTAKGGHYGKHT